MLVYWFLPMILLLGIITSYEDIEYGKIRNKWIFLSLIYSFVLYAYLIFFTSLYEISTTFFINLIVNSMLSLFIGFLMWNIKLWKAGDAKLFFVYTIMLPIYKSGTFSFINLLGNTFIPISIVFFIILLFSIKYKEKLPYLKRTFNLITIINIAFFIFGAAWIVREGMKYLDINSNIVIISFFMMLLYYTIEESLKIKLYIIGIVLSIARLIFDNSIFSFDFVVEFLIFLLIFLILRVFLLSLGSDYFVDEVKINDIKKGMIPAESIAKFKGRYFKGIEKQPFAKRITVKKYIINLNKEISDEEINELNSVKGELGFDTLKVHSTIYFAPFMFVGSLLTILLHGNLITMFFV